MERTRIKFFLLLFLLSTTSTISFFFSPSFYYYVNLMETLIQKAHTIIPMCHHVSLQYMHSAWTHTHLSFLNTSKEALVWKIIVEKYIMKKSTTVLGFQKYSYQETMISCSTLFRRLGYVRVFSFFPPLETRFMTRSRYVSLHR